MADGPLVLAVDQGTSSTKALLVDAAGKVVARAVAPVTERQPRPGWVEQDADELWHSVRAAVTSCVEPAVAHRIEAVGLSTQRESLVLWDRRTGEPLGPLLSWQDQRTNDACRDLTASGSGPLVRSASGMPLDPMFSALKARWLLDIHDPERRRAKAGELCLGTVDSWLLSRFGGEHVTEVGNASRTQLLNIDTRQWDERLLDLFGVPAAVLPRVVGSGGDFPAVRDLWPVPDGVPVRAVLGDSHAAMFAHAGWRPGVVKATYGTGSSVMAVGDGGDSPQLCRSVAWDIDGPVHAVEGNIRATGRTLSWLAELFGTDVQTLLDEAPPASGPVQFVPAFGGLGAPWWDPDATAMLSGLTLGTRRGDLAAAALHAVAHQVDDVVTAVESTVGEVRLLLCDGGLTRSGRLMQTQADVGGRLVGRSAEQDLSCLGAADAAGLVAGLWTRADLEGRVRPVDEYHPATDRAVRAAQRARWHTAIDRARSAPATARSRA
ncbi:FGGY family carbohydrate kinase [Micromonospora robiginosa]|uniref:FGGY family carbohydrate kinase n=1 Tax=Micromonospora robiginosa TaxID=2749844 RepID=A0A7L6B4A4_9ACTN|nr:FGGY family carbohydrate kinase [Micromonospora ferruginea]QLQ36732.2 FGGY family carbohydrate kinase [Micromonospora ferruginea]